MRMAALARRWNFRQLLLRFSEDGLLPRTMRELHPRFGTASHLIDLVAIAQLAYPIYSDLRRRAGKPAKDTLARSVRVEWRKERHLTADAARNAWLTALSGFVEARLADRGHAE